MDRNEKSPSSTSSASSTFRNVCAKTHSSGTFVMSYLTYISPRLATSPFESGLWFRLKRFRVFVSQFTRIHLEKLQLEYFSAGWSMHGPISILGGERGGNYSQVTPHTNRKRCLQPPPLVVKKSDWPSLNVTKRRFVQSPSELMSFFLYDLSPLSNVFCGLFPRWTSDIFLIDMSK